MIARFYTHRPYELQRSKKIVQEEILNRFSFPITNRNSLQIPSSMFSPYWFLV